MEKHTSRNFGLDQKPAYGIKKLQKNYFIIYGGVKKCLQNNNKSLLKF